MDGLEGRFTDTGRRAGTAVLFLHAFPYSSAMWDGQVRAFADRARCLTLDARGMRPGAAAPEAYMLEHLVDDALALMDRQGLEGVVVCGLSLGGYIALRLTQRAPERVRGLLLANTQAASDSNEAKLARAGGLRLLWTQGVEAFAEAQLKRQLSAQTLARRPELVTHLKQITMASSPAAIAAALVALATRGDMTSSLADVRVPTSVIVGADDVITTPAVASALASGIAGAELHTLAGAGHLSNLEAEQAFNEQLEDLLARVS
jgi:3-oxoadipate enol-lactonase